jgi:putative tricarboxylic transport membrane protein
MRFQDVPLAPAVLGLILGPMAEQHFRRAVAIAGGDYAVFLSRPLSTLLLVVSLFVLLAPMWRGRVSKNEHLAR